MLLAQSTMFPKFQAFTSYNEQLGQVPLTVVLTVFALPVISLVFARFIGGTVCKDMATGMLLIKILQTHVAIGRDLLGIYAGDVIAYMCLCTLVSLYSLPLIIQCSLEQTISFVGHTSKLKFVSLYSLPLITQLDDSSDTTKESRRRTQSL